MIYIGSNIKRIAEMEAGRMHSIRLNDGLAPIRH